MRRGGIGLWLVVALAAAAWGKEPVARDWDGATIMPVQLTGHWAVGPVPRHRIHPGYTLVWGPNGPVPYLVMPPLLIGPIAPVANGPAAVAPRVDPGPPLPPVAVAPLGPVGAVVRQPAAPRPEPARPTRPERARELTTFGHRLFRAGNLPRAVERFEQAIKADPNAAAPRVGLMQVALARGDYAEAATRLREAQAADPDWLAHARDVEALYPEPGDFARQLGRIESHLQAHPRDRDAWLILGAQYYLSGRTRKAADIFIRLTDRRPDATLAAFLEATRVR